MMKHLNLNIKGLDSVVASINMLRQHKELQSLSKWQLMIALLGVVPAIFFIFGVTVPWLMQQPLFHTLHPETVKSLLQSGPDSTFITRFLLAILSWIMVMLGGILSLILWLLMFITGIFLATVMYVATLNIFCRPFNLKLADAVEAINPTANSNPISTQIQELNPTNETPNFWINAQTELIRLGVFWALFLPLHLLSLKLPGIGHAIKILVLGVYGICWLVLIATSYTPNRRDLTLRQQLTILLETPLQKAIYSSSIFIIALIPLLNILAMPILTISGHFLSKKEFDIIEEGDAQ
jgi:uncharacterized protein involved in cysteine biosynthesis